MNWNVLRDNCKQNKRNQNGSSIYLILNASRVKCITELDFWHKYNRNLVKSGGGYSDCRCWLFYIVIAATTATAATYSAIENMWIKCISVRQNASNANNKSSACDKHFHLIQ